MIQFGIENLIANKSYQEIITGKIAFLCHAASVDRDLTHDLIHLKKIYGPRLIKVFGPQHGFVCDVQDNMVETQSFQHPYFNLPVYSLYGEYRAPTSEMLKDVDTLVIDLQDVGTRVYTYITTVSLCMEVCEKLGIKIVILDRPNPVGGALVEGNILKEEWKSFVGHHPIPMRHGLTMGEIARLQQKLYCPSCELEIIPVTGWKRKQTQNQWQRPWVNPSPNLATPNSAYAFCGSVLFEGTNWSEGRGTTRALEIIGAPNIEPFQFCLELDKSLKSCGVDGVVLKPSYFWPTFQKHSGTPCGGVHLYITDPEKCHTWALGQIILHHAYHHESFDFAWNENPYEYQFSNLAIDYINGDSALRDWVEKPKLDFQRLKQLELSGHDEYLNLRDGSLLYS